MEVSAWLAGNCGGAPVLGCLGFSNAGLDCVSDRHDVDRVSNGKRRQFRGGAVMDGRVMGGWG